MAENDPNPPGGPTPPPPSGVPPRPGDAAKVQPKKETVRISLPPKPSATATIKLPSIPGGPAPAAPVPGAGPAPATPAPSKPLTPAPAAAPAPPRPPTSGAPSATVARPPTSTGGPVPRPPGAPAPRPPAHAPVPAAKRLSGLDVGLAIAAAVVGIGAVVSILLLMQLK